MTVLKSILKTRLFAEKNNRILHNPIVLYSIFFVSLGQLFYLNVDQDYNSIILFTILCFLISFFSKNMTVILFLATSITFLVKYGVSASKSEGFELLPLALSTPEEKEGEEKSEKPEKKSSCSK
jgi:hypothetical protein